MLGFGGVGLLALAVYYAIDTEKNSIRVLSYSYILLINLTSIYYVFDKKDEIYLVVPLFTLLLGGIIKSIYKALD